MSKNITYRFKTPHYSGSILYVNIIANYSCTNNCLFCSRPRNKLEFGKKNIYETKANANLFLNKVPSKAEIMSEIRKNIRKSDTEIAIIGLGEPLINFELVVEIIKEIKKEFDIKVRVDSNGLVVCTHKNAANILGQAGLDEIRISLNATDAKDYETLCRPVYKNSFSKLCKFVKQCSDVMDTYVSFITNFREGKVKTKPKSMYLEFAKRLGISKEKVILRKFVPPI